MSVRPVSLRKGQNTERYRFPNVVFGKRLGRRALAWRLAWWLLKRVAMPGHTRLQQAAMISDALGAYRPERPRGALAPPPQPVMSGGGNVTITFGPRTSGAPPHE